MLKLPVENPSDCARAIAATYRDGSIGANRGEALEHAWNLLGYSLQRLGQQAKENGGSIPMASPKKMTTPFSFDQLVNKFEVFEALSPEDKKQAGEVLTPAELYQFSKDLIEKLVTNGF
jgi:hypothetical protein